MIFSNLPDLPSLGVNIDHVATLRNARGGRFPDPVDAARLAVEAGADIITFHLREDRRHIRDEDVERLKAAIGVPLNFEAALNDDVLRIIETTRPEHVCLVPERRLEITTEGGLDVARQQMRVRETCARLAAAGCRVSLFINADPRQIEASAEAGAPCIEIHTGAFANAWWAGDAAMLDLELTKVRDALRRGRALGLQTNAGHGLALADPSQARIPSGSLPGTRGVEAKRAERAAAPEPARIPSGDRPMYPSDEGLHLSSSTALIAALPEVTELHIGHALIGHALFVGLRQAVADFRAEMVRARTAARNA
jgi:pyridoxine 5-phosphate synthase